MLTNDRERRRASFSVLPVRLQWIRGEFRARDAPRLVLRPCRSCSEQATECRIERRIPAAVAERDPVLVDTLPALLDYFAEALSPDDTRHGATDGNTLAEEHGGERVRVTRFRLEDVMTEYRLLRSVLVSVLEADEPLTDEELSTLHGSLDATMSKAAIAYLLVEQGLRERVFAVLAHDLRGPLGTVSMTLQLIATAPASAQVPVWVGRAKSSIDRADRMVQDLLDAMRMHAGEHLTLPLEAVTSSRSFGTVRARHNPRPGDPRSGDRHRPQPRLVHPVGRDGTRGTASPARRAGPRRSGSTRRQHHGAQLARPRATFTIDVPLDARPHQSAPRTT